MRALIEDYALLMIPMASFWEWVSGKRTQILFLAVVPASFLLVLNQFQTRQYGFGIIHWDSMTKESYFRIFGKTRLSKADKRTFKSPNYAAALKGKPE
jgi:hypothetical protein